MTAHADVLDRPEPIAVPFWVSVSVHVFLLAVVILAPVIERGHRIQMGSPTGGGFGSVSVTPVATIPLPNLGGPVNPVANDTRSQTPPPPAPKPAKVQPKTKAPSPDAIPLPGKSAKKQPTPAVAPRNTWADKQPQLPNQVYSTVGQHVSSPQIGMQGGGGVRIGDNSPFGEQFGAYANLIRENIERQWSPTVQNSRGAPAAVITFTIQKSGAISNVKVGQSSGNSEFDRSAQRAIIDTQLPPLPQGFPRDHADVEMRFELGR